MVLLSIFGIAIVAAGSRAHITCPDGEGPGTVADKIGVEAASGKVTNTLVFAGSCGLVLGQRAANHTPPGVRFYFRSSLSLKT